jgi:hypothetical protein
MGYNARNDEIRDNVSGLRSKTLRPSLDLGPLQKHCRTGSYESFPTELVLQ